MDLYKYLPVNNIIDWDLIEKEILHPFVDKLRNTEQEYIYHQEGNVLIHTKMVCEALIKLEEYNKLNKRKQLELFLSALFHDIGKTVCSKIEDGKIVSPHHAGTGALMVREYFWKELKYSGNKEYQKIRETICLLIKYHSKPIFIFDEERQIIKISLNNNLADDFSIEMLCILSKADIIGRIGPDQKNQLEKIEICKLNSMNLNCYDKAFVFNNNYTKFQYSSGSNIWYNDTLYDNTYGEVILICGLPGTGKDTYIKKHYPNLDVISLDDIRRKLDIDPTDEQGLVYNTGKELAKEYLRQKKSFVWNATNLTNLIRQKQIKLFHDYHASVRIVFLETSYDENIQRNENRENIVPISIIDKMLRNLMIPEDYEAEIVEWVII